MKKAEMQMWAIKWPNRPGSMWPVSFKRRWVIEDMLKIYRDVKDPRMRTWRYWYRQGYRCIRVVVKEASSHDH